jgi:purine-binding chemotaxis protein CheW
LSTQLVVFALGKEEYGIDVSAVNGILRTKKFTVNSIPGTSKVIEGMINVRGKVNYVINLHSKFGKELQVETEESKFIMLNVDNANACCIVDEVTDIVKLEDGDINLAPAFVRGNNAKYIKGIGQIGERMIIILEPASILTFEEHASLDSSLGASNNS